MKASNFSGLQWRNKMSKYKLMYFDVRGRAEICRLIFAAAGQEVYIDFVNCHWWAIWIKQKKFKRTYVHSADFSVTLNFSINVICCQVYDILFVEQF